MGKEVLMAVSMGRDYYTRWMRKNSELRVNVGQKVKSTKRERER